MSNDIKKRNKHSVMLVIMRVLFTIFMAGTVIFIFGNSRQLASASGLKSQNVTLWLNNIVAKTGVGFRFTEHIVRKLAHFSEFALLGFWGMFTLRVYTKRTVAFVCWPLLFGLSVATMDETIQLFVDGRGSDVKDVVIDFAGVLAGLCLAMLIQLLVGAIFASFKALIGIIPDAEPTEHQLRRKQWPVFLRVLLPILAVVVVGFIFSNSMRTGPESGEISRKAASVLSGVPVAELPEGTLLEAGLRKIGHFLEFAVLGMVLMFAMRAFTRRIIAFSAWPVLLSLLTAVLDEFIQRFVPGRASLVKDVWIDMLGAIAGMAVGLVILAIGLLIDRLTAKKHADL